MKAVVVREFGGPEVLTVEQLPDPEPGPEEVLITVRSVSVNRTFDLAVRCDGNNRGATFPIVFGADPAGVVCAVGDGVTGLTSGQRVAVYSVLPCGECRECAAGKRMDCARPRQIGIHRWGGYAEKVCVPAANVYPIPDNLSFAEATVFLRHAPAAFHQIDDKAEVGAGEWVLVMGAAGALGSFCVQAAKLRGARVIAAAGAADRVAAAVALGAEAGIDYRREDLAGRVMEITDAQGVDVVCENIADPDLWPGAFASLGNYGRLVTMGAHGGGKVTLDVRELYRRRIRIIAGAGAGEKNFADALNAAAKGELVSLIHEIMPLARAADAHRLLETGNPIGKIILDPTL